MTTIPGCTLVELLRGVNHPLTRKGTKDGIDRTGPARYSGGGCWMDRDRAGAVADCQHGPGAAWWSGWKFFLERGLTTQTSCVTIQLINQTGTRKRDGSAAGGKSG